MNLRISKYKMGWIGLRVEKLGKSKKSLKKIGFFKIGHAELNNRNAFDFLLPVADSEKFNQFKKNPQILGKGLSAIAIWFTDAQWGQNAGITDKQWQNRFSIEND